MLIQTNLLQKKPCYTKNIHSWLEGITELRGRISLDNIALKRNWIISGGSPDIERTAVYVLRDFREGKIGKFIFDDLEG